MFETVTPEGGFIKGAGPDLPPAFRRPGLAPLPEGQSQRRKLACVAWAENPSV